MEASELYALSQGHKCEGSRRCYWCGSPCTERWIHDDPPKLIGIKQPTNWSRVPCSPWICVGCWLWRRTRITANMMCGTQVDCQAVAQHSWLITPTEAKAISTTCRPSLWRALQHPPSRFALILRTEEYTIPTAIQMCVINEINDLRVNTPLQFTLNNTTLHFNLYELNDALKHDAAGHEPGVRHLAKMFNGMVKKAAEEPQEPKHAGHPVHLPDASVLRKRVKTADGDNKK